MKSFKELTRKFDYVNSDIESNFSLEDCGNTDYKLFHFDKPISSEDAVKEMGKEGYSAANLYELLSWHGWNEKDFVVALGSVGEVGGDRYVPCLVKDGSGRGLYLGWWGYGWGSHSRFFAVRNLSSDTRPSESALEPLKSLTLEHAVELCKKNGLEVYKKM